MFWQIFAACAGAALVVFLLWLARGAMLAPVPTGRNTRAALVLRLTGPEPALERTVDSLVWLRQNETLCAQIIIIDAGMDDETRRAALIEARRYPFVLCLDDEGWEKWRSFPE